MAMKAANSGMIILGGGLIKHHICNANLMVTKSISEKKSYEMLSISLFLSYRETGLTSQCS